MQQRPSFPFVEKTIPLDRSAASRRGSEIGNHVRLYLVNEKHQTWKLDHIYIEGYPDQLNRGTLRATCLGSK